MKYLFFDTETTGFGNARLVAIAWQLWNENALINKEHFVIKPVDFYIPLSATKVHGISHEFAFKYGKNLTTVLNLFEYILKQADLLIAHNYKYDYRIVLNEMKHIGLKTHLPDKKYYDTMIMAQKLLGLKKYPKLIELYKLLFNKVFDNQHSADADVNATVEIFFELQKRKR